MQISPRYDGQPILTMDGEPGAIAAPLVRQRRRLAGTLAQLDTDDWAQPSRCDGWTVQDVVAHLAGTDRFWTVSIGSGAAGEPTRFLSAFDPMATPETMVAATRATPPAEVLEEFTTNAAELCELIEGLDDEGWASTGESPAGHVRMDLVAHHALWDCWVHERDIVIPLGLEVTEEADEVEACLRYVAALAPALAIASGGERNGSLVVDGTDPDVHVVVEADDVVHVHSGPAPEGAPTIGGRSADLVDVLSIRAPFDHAVSPDARWMFNGLAAVFDQAEPI